MDDPTGRSYCGDARPNPWSPDGVQRIGARGLVRQWMQARKQAILRAYDSGHAAPGVLRPKSDAGEMREAIQSQARQVPDRVRVPGVSPISAGPARRLADAARKIWRLDAISSVTPLKARPLGERRFRINGIRHLFQAGVTVVVLSVGWQFVLWERGLEAGRWVGSRPPGVEAFLPIAALMSLRHLWLTGQIHTVHPAGLMILLAALATSLLLKKAFCSWLCPVGTISEILAALSLKVFRRRTKLPRPLDIPLRSVKYMLLAFFLYAIFLAMRPDDLAAFLDSPYNRVADIKMLLFVERLSPLALKVLAGIALLSFVIPYFWCRYLCPYGALLGLVSLLSPLKVTRDAPSCIDCGLCARACPSHLRVDRLTRVRSDECFGCLSCVAACPVTRALRVEAPPPWRVKVRPAVFAALVLSMFAGVIGVARAWGPWRNSISDAEYATRVHEIDEPRYQH
jgi:polyferredoxin